MRRHVLTLAFAAASLAAALPTAAAHAAGGGTPAPRAADGGVYATVRATDAQQRAFWADQENRGTLRPFKGELRDWKPNATPPKAEALGAGRTVKAPAATPTVKGKRQFAVGSAGETRLRATTGRVRIAVPSEEKPGWWDIVVCTGNVITSNNKDMVATARHCIPHDDQGRINPRTEYEFTPGYYVDANGEHAPYGKWTTRGLGVVGSLTDPAPQTDDTAFLALNTQNGTHVQDAVGASGYQFNIGSLPRQVVFAGIPGNSNQFHMCVKQPYWGSDNPPQIMGSGGPCTGDSDLSGGASGGPLLSGDTFDSGPIQIGDYSGSAGNDPGAAAWRDTALAVFNNMQGTNGQPAQNKVTTLTNWNNNLADLYQ
ncbi:trypsin-like serine protease [Streptomyces melanogenes]|uniref:trypsin-like serine protease n=1 Tax=Streptomyces melanogenes TaxID=67326 RepID=UPI0037BB1884